MAGLYWGMGLFLQRPLMWLFVAATLCLDVVGLVAEVHLWSAAKYFWVGLLCGQAWSIAAWLSAGAAHRLIRGAGFVLAMIGLATFAACWNRHEASAAPWWGRMFTVVCIFGMTAAIAAAAAGWVGRRRVGRREQQARWQFPVVELFGWTIVVAIASWALRFSMFGTMLAHDSTWYVVLGSITAGAALGYFFAQYRERLAHAALVASAMLATFAAVAWAMGRVAERDVSIGFRWGYLYLGVLGLVAALDRRGFGERREQGAAAPLAIE